jgi:hypothetical protein
METCEANYRWGDVFGITKRKKGESILVGWTLGPFNT